MLGVEAIEGVPSSCHRDVDFVTFVGTQVSDFVDGMSGPRARRYRQMLYHDEVDSRDGMEVSEHDNCLRAETVGVARGSVDGMCLNICHL
jgi:hypothetical protein